MSSKRAAILFLAGLLVFPAGAVMADEDGAQAGAKAGNGAENGKVKIGLLDCAIKSGDDGVLQSAKDLSCTFQRDGDQPPDVYFGQIRRVGLDLGKTEGGVIRWLVFAKTEGQSATGSGARTSPEPGDAESGVLAGDYVGISAEATLGVGIGANALIGGGDHSIVLQPMSLKSQIGLNLAAGITELELRSLN
ncbi:DUF992 domain-containing protein [Breoghania corrubedonensis]|nr:DUF992 domain-containing protein [Breoghania corrubedonensis]